MRREKAMKEVRDGLSAKVYEYIGKGNWRVYRHRIFGIETEVTRKIPDRVFAEHKATGARVLFHDGFFDIRTVDDDGGDREVIIIDKRRERDVEAAGEFIAGLVKGFWR